jgi:hypothetical protein
MQNVTCYSVLKYNSGLFFVGIALRKEGSRPLSSYQVFRGSYYVFTCNIVTRGFYLV